MDNKFIKIFFGFLFFSFLSFSVFPAGWHPASQITPAQFSDGNFSFNGSLGIRTTNPLTELDISGRWFVTEHGTSPTSGAGMFGSFNPAVGSGVGLIQGWNYTSGTAKNIAFQSAGGNVGIGTSSPSRKLDISGTGDTAVRVTSIDNTAAFQIDRGLLNKDGQILYYTNKTLDWRIGQLGGVVGSGKNLYIYDSVGSNTAMTFKSNSGNVGIGRTPTTNTLEVNGGASKSTSGSWLANSDKRIKIDIQNISNAIKTIMKLRPVKFKYTENYKQTHPSIKNQYYYNYIAQEYKKVFPNSVKGSGEYLNGTEILQMDSYNAQIVSIKAIQEQQKQIEDLKEIICLDHSKAEICIKD